MGNQPQKGKMPPGVPGTLSNSKTSVKSNQAPPKSQLNMSSSPQ